MEMALSWFCRELRRPKVALTALNLLSGLNFVSFLNRLNSKEEPEDEKEIFQVLGRPAGKQKSGNSLFEPLGSFCYPGLDNGFCPQKQVKYGRFG
jgi:hypothetical protein